MNQPTPAAVKDATDHAGPTYREQHRAVLDLLLDLNPDGHVNEYVCEALEYLAEELVEGTI